MIYGSVKRQRINKRISVNFENIMYFYLFFPDKV